MSALSSEELIAIREAIAELLPDTCDITASVSVSDGAGGYTDTWSIIVGGTAVPFRLDVKSGQEVLAGGALQPFTKLMGSLPYDITITTQNRINHGGYEYRISSTNVDQSWIGVKRVNLERV